MAPSSPANFLARQIAFERSSSAKTWEQYSLARSASSAAGSALGFFGDAVIKAWNSEARLLKEDLLSLSFSIPMTPMIFRWGRYFSKA